MRPAVIVLLLALSACASSGGESGALPEPGSAPARAAVTDTYAVLVIEEAGGVMKVLKATRVSAADLGPGRSVNGAGAPTHRWALRGPSGELVASGDIAVRRDVHVPPDPRQGTDAAHVELASTVFVVRVPWPAVGQAIEIAVVSGGAAAQGAALPVLRWQP